MSTLRAERCFNMFRIFLTAMLAMVMSPLQNPATTQTTATADAPTAAHKDRSPVPATNVELAPTDPVITIHGLCTGAAGAKAKSSDCTTVVTRQQFDAVERALNAIGGSILPAQRRSVAEGYAATLMSYEAAKKAGVERDPRFAEVMRLARMRAMGDMYRELETEKARKVSPSEIQAYYKKNIDKFDELALRRVVVPRFNQANLKDEAFVAKARKVADDIHERMAKGEDLDKLQKEAFDALDVKNPPATKMGPVRRGIYAEDQEKQLFALKPGEVTAIIEQPSTFLIFKLEGRELITVEKSKDEITRTLIKQHLEKESQASSSTVQIKYNEQYVGAPQASPWMPASQFNGAASHANGNAKEPVSKSSQPK
jgi:DNA-binding FrmR family transcriptional regulator